MEKVAYLRVELPSDLHRKFMRKVKKEFGTYHSQWRAVELLFDNYARGKYQIKKRQVKKEENIRVLSTTLPSHLRDKAKEKIVKEYGSVKKFSLGIANLIQMYVNNDIAL